nr:MAG TPA: hypothetical protein [Caudoviricetes sp.]
MTGRHSTGMPPGFKHESLPVFNINHELPPPC